MSSTGLLLVEFNRGDPSEVIDHMTRLSASLGGWINFQPNIDPEDVSGSGFNLLSIFSARGPAIPLATWMPGLHTRKGEATPPEIGIQHPAGSRAIPVLRTREIDLPDGWRPIQDHPKRGLVVRLPAAVSPNAILRWLLDAATALCAYPLPDSWLAAVYER
jgi:hypothetical protein